MSISGSSGVLSDLVPVTAGHIVKAQRRTRRLGLSDCLLGLLALRALYCFGFAARCGFGTAEKAMASHLEVEPEVRRARTLYRQTCGRIPPGLQVDEQFNITIGEHFTRPALAVAHSDVSQSARCHVSAQRLDGTAQQSGCLSRGAMASRWRSSSISVWSQAANDGASCTPGLNPGRQYGSRQGELQSQSLRTPARTGRPREPSTNHKLPLLLVRRADQCPLAAVQIIPPSRFTKSF